MKALDHFDGRSNSALAKNAGAERRILLARRSSRFSFSSCRILAAASTGSTGTSAASAFFIQGDSYNNAMAEALNSLYKAERVHSMLDYRTPIEVETAYHPAAVPVTAAA